MSLQKHILIILFLVFASPLAQAEKSGASTSEFYHQADDNKFELTPTLNYMNITAKFNRSLSSIESSKVTGLSTSVRGEYGLNSNYSLSAALAYNSSETTYEPASANIKTNNTKGVADPIITFAGHMPLPTGALHYGANLSVSLIKSTSDYNGNANAATGGSKLAPYLGYDFDAGSLKLGAQIAYELIKGDRTNEYTASNGVVTTTTTSGGEELTIQAFGELPINSALLGLSVGLADTKATASTTNGTTTQNKNAGSTTLARVYGTLPVGNVTLLSSLTYVSYKYADKNYADLIDSVNGWLLTAGARFVF